MLSSGTLNLKFMQRNKNQQNQNPTVKPSKTEKNVITTTTTSEKNPASNTDPSRTQPERRFQRSDESNHQFHQQSTLLTILFEDSLIGFPLLSFRRYPNVPDPSNSILPAHVGRKSFGDFNKAIQNLGETDSITTHKRPQYESSARQMTSHKKPRTIEAQDFRKPVSQTAKKAEGPNLQRGAKPEIPSNPNNKKTTRTTAATTTVVCIEEEATRSHPTTSKHSTQPGFQKPYQATTIKAKRKRNDPTNSTDRVAQSRPSNPLPASSSSSSSPKDQRGDPRPTQSSKSTVISRKDVDQQQQQEEPGQDSSEDSELVNHEIELMFKEARKARRN